MTDAGATAAPFDLDEDGIPRDVRTYKQKAYWDYRFGREDAYDWVADIDALPGLLEELIATTGDAGRCLILGCGTSSLTEKLVRGGLRPDQLVSVDYSEVVIDKMRARHGDACGEWLVAGV